VGIAWAVLAQTAVTIMEGITGARTMEGREGREARRHWYVHAGRWLMMASQLQEVAHTLIKTKGE